jgi:uncharacterized protein YrrD
MLRGIKELFGYSIHAEDADFGKVHDFLIDDGSWDVRYLVVDTRKWLPGRKVLLPPAIITCPEGDEHKLLVSLSKQQIIDSPSLATHEPVSGQHEVDLYRYYGWQPYWFEGMTAGIFPRPVSPEDEVVVEENIEIARRDKPAGDPHLRSAKEIIDYNVHASDGEIGDVIDIIVDDATWIVRYIAVDIRNLVKRKHVLIAVPWIKEITWEGSKIRVDLPKDKIKTSPDWDSSTSLDREYETKLYDHYGKTKYWQ